MQANKTALTLISLVAVAILAFAPVVAADPISPSLNWSVQSVPKGLSTTATVTVAIDPDCPSGQTFSGTITVTEPDGTSVATYTVPPTACGSAVTASYPSAFTGTAGTTELGTYTASWAGASSLIVDGNHPSFTVGDYFTVVAFQPPPTVPEFGAPAMLVAAMGLLLVVAIRKGKMLKV
jgi:hypothetical protein